MRQIPISELSAAHYWTIDRKKKERKKEKMIGKALLKVVGLFLSLTVH